MFTKILQPVLVGVDLAHVLEWGDSREEAYTFDSISTTQFFPKEHYIQRCIASDPVLSFLEKSKFRKPVYVITGVKIVTGVKGGSRQLKSSNSGLESKLSAGTDFNLCRGPGLTLHRRGQESMSWEGSSDFVFAFRAVRVKVSGNICKTTTKMYLKGAMMGTDESDASEDAPVFAAEVEEAGGGEQGYELEKLREGDTLICCVVSSSAA